MFLATDKSMQLRWKNQPDHQDILKKLLRDETVDADLKSEIHEFMAQSELMESIEATKRRVLQATE